MAERFKCTEQLSLELRDEDGMWIENEYFIVSVGEVWEKCDLATMSDVRLEKDRSWIEVCDETLESHFVQI